MTTLIPLPTPNELDLKLIERCDSSVRFRRLIELALVRRLVGDLLTAGYLISVYDGEEMQVERDSDVEAIIDAVFSVDECHLHVHDNKPKPIGWVFIVLGNSGWDSINDHTTNLEDVLKGTDEYADQLCEWC